MPKAVSNVDPTVVSRMDAFTGDFHFHHTDASVCQYAACPMPLLCVPCDGSSTCIVANLFVPLAEKFKNSNGVLRYCSPGSLPWYQTSCDPAAEGLMRMNVFTHSAPWSARNTTRQGSEFRGSASIMSDDQ